MKPQFSLNDGKTTYHDLTMDFIIVPSHQIIFVHFTEDHISLSIRLCIMYSGLTNTNKTCPFNTAIHQQTWHEYFFVKTSASDPMIFRGLTKYHTT